jgi:hypothetical protein
MKHAAKAYMAGVRSFRLLLSFRSETLGAPSLRFLQGRVRCCRLLGHAQRPAPHLRRASPALHHLLMLPALAFSRYRWQPRLLPLNLRTDLPALSVRGCRACGNAQAHSSTFDGTGDRKSVDGDAGVEGAHGPHSATKRRRRNPRQRNCLETNHRRVPTLAFLARMGIRNAYPEGFTADSPGSQSPNRPEKDSRSHPRKQSSPPGDSISVPQLCCCRQ